MNEIKDKSIIKTCYNNFHSQELLKINTNSNSCSDMISNCKECKTNRICSKCDNNFIINKTNNKCVDLKLLKAYKGKYKSHYNSNIINPIVCHEGFYKNTKVNKCLKKITHCIKMNSNSKCEKCFKHYKLNQSRTKCIKCTPHCLKCNFANSCELCQTGFFPNYNPSNYYYLFLYLKYYSHIYIYL